MYDPIVVGSGAAKTFAARGLSGTKTLVIDAGVRFIEASFLDGNCMISASVKTSLGSPLARG